MRILKPGKIDYGREIRFECQYCGCEFLASPKDEDYLVDSYQCTDGLAIFIDACVCPTPECRALVHARAIREEKL